MNTKILKINPQNPNKEIIQQAADIIRAGGLVAFPTETVYGLGADGLNIQAHEKIHAAKQRPLDNPLILHIAKYDDVERLAIEISSEAKLIMQEFWPGPITLILRKNPEIPKEISKNLDTIALRMPKNPVARMLITEANTPIAAPSANTSGSPSPTMAEHVLNDLGGKIPMILNGGASAVGLESTVLDFSRKTPIILRPGAITHEMLEGILGKGKVEIFGDAPFDISIRPASPGMKYRHYAPQAKLTLVMGKMDAVVYMINKLTENKSKEKTAVIATSQTIHRYPNRQTLNLGDRENPESICANLFRILRTCDEMGLEEIFAEGLEENGLGAAIMNRLKKASGYNIIRLNH